MAMTKRKTFWAIALYIASIGQRVVNSLTIVSSHSNPSYGDVCDLTHSTCQRDINNINVIQSINIFCDHFHNENRTVSLSSSSLAPLITIRNCAQLKIRRKAISSDQDSTVLEIVNDNNRSHNLRLESESITGKFSRIVIRNVRSAVVETGAIKGRFNEAEIAHSEFQLLKPNAFEKLFVKNFTLQNITVKTWSTGSLALPYVCKQNFDLEMVMIKNCDDDPALVQKLVSPTNYDRNSNWACKLGKSLMCQDDTTSDIETASCDRVKHVNDLQAKFCEKYSKNNCQCKNQCVPTHTYPTPTGGVPVQEIRNCELSLKSKDLADVTNKDFCIAFINTRINTIESKAFENLNIGLIGLIDSKIIQIESKAFENVSVDVFKMVSSYEMNSLRVTKTAHAAFDIVAGRVEIQDSSFDFLDDHTFHYIKPRGKSSEMVWRDIMIQEFRPNALVLDENWLSQNIQAGRIKIQQSCGCEIGDIVGEKHNHDQPFMKKDSIWCKDPDKAIDKSWTEYENHKCEFHEVLTSIKKISHYNLLFSVS